MHQVPAFSELEVLLVVLVAGAVFAAWLFKMGRRSAAAETPWRGGDEASRLLENPPVPHLVCDLCKSPAVERFVAFDQHLCLSCFDKEFPTIARLIPKHTPSRDTHSTAGPTSTG